jgi:hypothetical protein
MTRTAAKLVVLIAVLVGVTTFALPALATPGAPQLQYIYGGGSGTVVFIHGKGDCSRGMGDCNGGDSTSGPAAYWTNDANGVTMLNEATTQYGSNGASYFEAFAIGYDYDNQGYWYAANDVGSCLRDLYQGTNWSGCNPSLYQRSSFHVVTHSAGATVMDYLLSYVDQQTWGYGIQPHLTGWVVSLAPALVGSRASSALYGQGYGNFCTGLVSWLAGWAFQNNAAASITRASVVGMANAGKAGRTSYWILKVPSTGGSYSANNDGCGTFWGGTTVREDDNDCSMGALAGCLGYSNSDDMDGLIYWSDADPTNNTGANGCNNSDTHDGNAVSCQYYGQYSGAYWHWFTTWANHSHSRDDAYTTLGDWQSASGCNTRSPGTCVGQYGL